MAAIVEVEDKKSFKIFPDMLPELRMMIVDEMKQDDRLKFSFTSKWCHREARASKYCIYGLELIGISQIHIRVSVIFNEDEKQKENDFGYTMDIRTTLGIKYVKCQSLRHKSMWTQRLDPSTDIVQYATDYFKKLLKPRYSSIRKLTICGRIFATWDFGLKNLNSIKDLKIDDDSVSQHILSEISHPLRKLELLGKYSTTRNIIDFIRSWHNGLIQSETGTYEWVVDQPKFLSPDFNQFMEFHRAFKEFRHMRRTDQSILFMGEHDAGKVAVFSGLWTKVLRFAWGDQSLRVNERETRACIFR